MPQGESNQAKFFLTGGTGLIGATLCRALLERGQKVVVVTRNRERAEQAVGTSVELVVGNPAQPGAWQERVRGCGVVYNLAGEPIARQRWSGRFKKKLRDSRVDTTHHVVQAIAALAPGDRPAVLASASGIDVYPFSEADEGGSNEEVTEKHPAGDTFMARLCRDWEAEAVRAGALGVRTVVMRTGIVLGKGGALPAITAPFKWFLGGRLGSGNQWMSWIHIADAVAAYLYAAEQSSLTGPVNLVAPQPVRNRDFSRALGAALHRPVWLPLPAFAIRAAAGELAEYLVHGRKAIPATLLARGFPFAYRTIDAALADLVAETATSR